MELINIQNKIYEIRNHKVMIDFDLAELYETDTKRLKEAVRRNIDRFPSDFMFELSKDEWDFLRSQIASLKVGSGKQPKYLPYAFTEQGVAMLASVLNSPKAIQVNIAIVRAFVMIRQYALTYRELSDRLKSVEGKFDDVYEAINYLLEKDKIEETQKQRTKIGFKK